MTRWPKPDGDRGYPGQPDGIVGGPALGWPAGNRGTGTEAEELLASAVGWWDVASFREGDRWLRNRGIAGPCLDMRLGSSTTPNSNDPLYLRPADRGYVYLPGATGNTISCTAPASATTYRATTTDGTTTTGAATGGAAFALQTAGSWTRVELLDAEGATVLDADCDAITSGSATSFLAATGQTVTINRATSGRKSVAVPSRNRTRSPLMLLGTDDYLEVQDAQQHKWANFDAGQSMAAVVVGRRWNATTTCYIGKRYDMSAGSVGWQVFHYTSGANLTVGVSDGISSVIATFGTVPGVLSVFVGRADWRTARLLSTYNNGAGATGNLRLLTGGFAVHPTPSRPQRLRIGQNGSGDYGDWEFYAAAVFRRALTDREIALVTDHYTQRIA